VKGRGSSSMVLPVRLVAVDVNRGLALGLADSVRTAAARRRSYLALGRASLLLGVSLTDAAAFLGERTRAWRGDSGLNRGEGAGATF
jgi:hypothetical protein